MAVEQPFLVILTVKNINRKSVYEHLLALCNNSPYFGMAKYENPTASDYQRITVIDVEAISSEIKRRSRGCVIGTVRLLPNDFNETATVIQFVHKDAIWSDPVINPDRWFFFIQSVKEYFSQLQGTRPINNEFNIQEKKGGRPSYEEDFWAWEQINIKARPKNEVYEEWLAKIKVNSLRTNMVDPKRQFNRIIKLNWGNKSRQNI